MQLENPEACDENQELAGMGTTLSMAFIVNKKAYITISGTAAL